MTTDLKAQILEAINDMINVYRMMPLHNGDDEEYREKLHAQDQIHHAITLLSDPNVFIGRWESMESAPEDGTPLLFTKDGGFEIGWMDWCPHAQKYYPSNEDAEVLIPTAWAHLPTAPEVKPAIKCPRCQDTGRWGWDEDPSAFECDHVTYEPEYTKEGYLIVEMPEVKE